MRSIVFCMASVFSVFSVAATAQVEDELALVTAVTEHKRPALAERRRHVAHRDQQSANETGIGHPYDHARNALQECVHMCPRFLFWLNFTPISGLSLMGSNPTFGIGNTGTRAHCNGDAD